MPRPKQPPPDKKRCTHAMKNGKRCERARLPGEDKCFSHSAKAAARRKAAQRKGGKNAHKPIATIPPEAVKLAFKRSMDVVDALEEVFDEVRKGIVDYRIGQTLAVLAATMLKALQYKESVDLDDQIAALGKQLEDMKRSGNAGRVNGQAQKARKADAVGSGDGVPGDTDEDTPGWLPDDEAGGDGSGPLAGEDAADPLWGTDADQR